MTVKSPFLCGTLILFVFSKSFGNTKVDLSYYNIEKNVQTENQKMLLTMIH